MDALFASLLPVLPEMTVGTLMFAFAMWRERVHHVAATRWDTERAGLIVEKSAAVKEARAQHSEDDTRKDKRIAGLAAENDELEKRLDAERSVRRAVEDQAQTVQFPRHRLRDEGTAS